MNKKIAARKKKHDRIKTGSQKPGEHNLLTELLSRCSLYKGNTKLLIKSKGGAQHEWSLHRHFRSRFHIPSVDSAKSKCNAMHTLIIQETKDISHK